MSGRHRLISGLCGTALALLGGCSSGSHSAVAVTNSAGSSSAPPAAQPVVFPADAEACPPDTSTPPAAQITLIHRQILYGVLPDGSNLHCLVDGRAGIDHWSADGRYYFDARGQVGSMVPGGSDMAYSITSVAAEEFARPDATASYFQVTKAGGGGILRYDFRNQQETPVSNLGGASDLTVSPDGSILAYAGYQSGAANASIWTVSTSGGQPTVVAQLPSTTAAGNQAFSNASSLSFVSANRLLYLQGNPGTADGPYQLMSLQLGQTAQPLTTIGKQLGAQATAGLVTAGNGSPWVASDFGDCADGITTSVLDISGSSPAVQAVPVASNYAFATPVGWLPDGRLALLARTDDCHGSGDLLLWKPGDSSTALLASGVSAAALRVTGSVQIPARITP